MRLTEIQIYAEMCIYKGAPQLILTRRIYAEKDINDLLNKIIRDEYIPARISAKNPFKFFAKLKELKLLEKVKKHE